MATTTERSARTKRGRGGKLSKGNRTFEDSESDLVNIPEFVNLKGCSKSCDGTKCFVTKPVEYLYDAIHSHLQDYRVASPISLTSEEWRSLLWLPPDGPDKLRVSLDMQFAVKKGRNRATRPPPAITGVVEIPPLEAASPTLPASSLPGPPAVYSWFLSVGSPVTSLAFSSPVPGNDFPSPPASGALTPQRKRRRVVRIVEAEASNDAAVHSTPPTSKSHTCFAQRQRQQRDSNDAFCVLAIGTHPRYSPVQWDNRMCKGTGWISLWKVPKDPTVAPTIRVIILHRGVFCRGLQWVRGSSSRRWDRVGLLATVTADGVVALHSIPSSPFTQPYDAADDSTYIPKSTTVMWSTPVWTVTPSPRAMSVSIPPVPIADSQSLEFPNGGWRLPVLVGCEKGIVYLWNLVVDKNGLLADLPPIAYPIMADIAPSAYGAVIAVSWAPHVDPLFFAASCRQGKVVLWDRRDPLRGRILDMDLTARPTSNLAWSPIARYILAGHTCGAVLNLRTGETTHHHPQRGGAGINRQSVELPAWDCAVFGSMGVFVYHNGCAIVGLLHDIDRKYYHGAYIQQWTRGAQPSRPSTNPVRPTPRNPPQPPESFEVEIESGAPLVQAYHEELQRAPWRSQAEVWNEGGGLHVNIMRLDEFHKIADREKKVKNPVMKTETPRTSPRRHDTPPAPPPEEKVDTTVPDASFEKPALYAVATLDTLQDPLFSRYPLVAVGGVAGVVHITNVDDLQIL